MSEPRGGLPHELRNALTAIKAAASSIQAAPDLDADTHRRLIQVILDCVDKMDALIGEISERAP